MTVQELIDLLSALPEAHKTMEVICSYGVGHGFTGIDGVEAIPERNHVVLEGD